jgi:hypothetical protein
MKWSMVKKNHDAWTLCLRIAALVAALWALYDLVFRSRM